MRITHHVDRPKHGGELQTEGSQVEFGKSGSFPRSRQQRQHRQVVFTSLCFSLLISPKLGLIVRKSFVLSNDEQIPVTPSSPKKAKPENSVRVYRRKNRTVYTAGEFLYEEFLVL